ncbi:MAG: glycosyltransferase family 4 protein [Christensenellales bacterium]
MKKICFLTNKYPNPLEPNVLVFLQQFVWSVADQGYQCTVICPLPINIQPKFLGFPKSRIEKTENGKFVKISYPKYISYGLKERLFFKLAVQTTNNYTRAVCSVVEAMKEKPDAIYGHFAAPAGIAAARVGQKYKIPSFMAYGEATFKTIAQYGVKRAAQELKDLNGVIAVSGHNREMFLSVDTIEESRVKVFPNGFRKERFYQRNKQEARDRFGLPRDAFIVCFVGSFDHRKGIDRLMKAVNESEGVYAICAGNGKLVPKGDKCLYNKSVRNDELPWFYSAGDVFVLPTLHEGCCNAIIEAMACGLPIISSDLSFNDELLDDSCALRIDPNDINEIKSNIMLLKENKEIRMHMANASLKKSEKLSLASRASRILNWMEEISYGGSIEPAGK